MPSENAPPGTLASERNKDADREPKLVYGLDGDGIRYWLVSSAALDRLDALYCIIEESRTWGEFYEALDNASEDVRQAAIRFFGLDFNVPVSGEWTEDDDPRFADPHPPPHCRFGYFDWWMSEGDWSWPGFPQEPQNADLPDDLTDALAEAGLWVSEQGFAEDDLGRVLAIAQKLRYPCEEGGFTYRQM